MIKIDPVKFAKLTPQQQLNVMQNAKPEQIQELLSNICKVTQITIKDAEKYERQIRESTIKINELENKKLLEKVNTFDPSDIRLRLESDLDGMDRVVNAEWWEDHIELYVRKWGWHFPPARTLEYIAFVLNHEYLHQIINKILLEDGLYFNEKEHDGHWPFFAGEIDLIYDVSSSNLKRDHYEDVDSIRNTKHLLANCAEKPKVDFSKWAWL